MAVCPSCGSSRLRSGYHTAPLPLRLIGIRTLLCDNCNYEFRAFSPIAPKRNRVRRAQRKADVFNLAPAVDLQAIGQPGAGRPAPTAIHFDRTALPIALTNEPAVEADVANNASRSTDDEGFEDDIPSNVGININIDEDDFAPLDLRERMSEVPPSLPTEEPLMQLKEDLEERRGSSASRACPACGDHEATRRHRKTWERLVFGLTELRPYLCPNCGHQFYARRLKHRRQRTLSQREEEFVKSSCFNQERPEHEELTSSGQEREGNDG